MHCFSLTRDVETWRDGRDGADINNHGVSVELSIVFFSSSFRLLLLLFFFFTTTPQLLHPSLLKVSIILSIVVVEIIVISAPPSIIPLPLCLYSHHTIQVAKSEEEKTCVDLLPIARKREFPKALFHCSYSRFHSALSLGPSVKFPHLVVGR